MRATTRTVTTGTTTTITKNPWSRARWWFPEASRWWDRGGPWSCPMTGRSLFQGTGPSRPCEEILGLERYCDGQNLRNVDEGHLPSTHVARPRSETPSHYPGQKKNMHRQGEHVLTWNIVDMVDGSSPLGKVPRHRRRRLGAGSSYASNVNL